MFGEDLTNIKLDMEWFAKNYTQDDLDFYKEMLLKYKSDIGMLVTFAGSYGDVGLLNEMAEAGKYDPLYITPVEKWNFLHKCNINPNAPYPMRTVRFYLDRGVEVNAQDGYGMTPLHYALRAGNGDAALVLLEAGADPNIANRDNLIPLSMIGYLPDRLDILEAMLKAGADVHHNNGRETVLESYLPGEGEEHLIPIYELMKKYS